MDSDIDASTIIERLGGTTAVAAIFDIKPPSVSEWKEKNCIPRARLMYLKVAHPDAFQPDAFREAPAGQTRADGAAA